MSTLSSSSMPPMNSAALDDAMIGEEEITLRATLPWRATDWLTAEGLRHRAKRAVDVAGALTALVLLWWLMVGIALLIKFTSRGPILFQQARRGYRGRLFNVLKFRTMTVDAEQRLVDLESSNESAGGVLFKLKNDPRVTRVGAFLRRHSLDELPQLINVIFGEMSLVGPRPLVSDEDECINGWQRTRLDLPPGMTGFWQVLGSSRVPMHEMVKLDYLYGANWSLWLDVKVILRTVPHMLGRRGL
jgi:lipopolysaccharide/colanic/teichoic acid biosynthesis glycosyltransferase